MLLPERGRPVRIGRKAEKNLSDFINVVTWISVNVKNSSIPLCLIEVLQCVLAQVLPLCHVYCFEITYYPLVFRYFFFGHFLRIRE